jgi:creatinine amidohydrolase
MTVANEVEFRRLRADELRARAAADAVAIIPFGSIEQHGPHLPVEVDSLLGNEVALRTARKMDARGTPVVVLPAVWTGVSEHHMEFGGTITLDLATYAALAEGICRSLVRHGFRRLVLLNGHGGNDNALRCITDEITPRLGVPIIQFTYWHPTQDLIAAELDTQTSLLHACEAETAMTMALRPDLVAEARIPAASQAMEYVQPGPYRWRTLGSVSASGVIGNPAAASAAKGERLLDVISTRLADLLCNADLWAAPWKQGG